MITLRNWVLALGCFACSTAVEAQAICSLEWRLDETLRIGSIDGDDALMWVNNLAIGPDGEIYVPQTAIGSVMVFSPDGSLLRTFGREGSGPGDFESGPRTVWWVAGELWVADRLRTQSFGSDGRPNEFVSFQTWVPSEGSTFRPEAPLADGSFWGRRSMSPIAGDAGQPRTLSIRRFDREGGTLDTIAVIDVRDRRVVINPQSGGFAEHPIWSSLPGSGLGRLRQAVTEDRSGVVLIGDIREEPGGGTFDLLRIAITGDTVLRRSVSYEPRRITRAEEDWWLREFGAFVAEDSLQGQPRVRDLSDAWRNRMRERAREAFWLPTFYPPVRQILAGSDGTVWLLREFEVLEPVDRWEVYDAEGVLIGRTAQPGRARRIPWLPRLQILRASRNEVWATTTDDFDVTYIHRYRVDRGCG